MRRAWWLVGVAALSGCLPFTEEQTLLVSGNPFQQPTQLTPLTQAHFSPASKETALRVDQAGQKLVQGNPQLKFRPLFATIGSPRLELFHVAGVEQAAEGVRTAAAPLSSSTPVVYITEGLARRCTNEIELSAVLSYELGRIVAEREAAVSPRIRSPEKLPPIQLPIGGPGQSAFGPDRTAIAELARFEKTHPKAATLPPPDARKIASTLLDRAGYPATALEVIDPLLREAEHNAALERQIKGGTLPTWSPE